MPGYETRGMGSYAEVGELPQSKLYGSTSAHNYQKSRNSGSQSLRFVLPLIIFPPNTDGAFLCVAEICITNSLASTTNTNATMAVNTITRCGEFQFQLIIFCIHNSL